MFAKLQAYAKFVVAMLGAVLAGGSLLIPEDWGKWVTFAITVLTAFSVYGVPNHKEETIDGYQGKHVA